MSYWAPLKAGQRRILSPNQTKVRLLCTLLEVVECAESAAVTSTTTILLAQAVVLGSDGCASPKVKSVLSWSTHQEECLLGVTLRTKPKRLQNLHIINRQQTRQLEVL